MRIVFATSNVHKFQEVTSILRNYPIVLDRRDVKGSEIQSEDLEEIAETSVLGAVKRTGKPTLVEDAGLFIQALRGFPGGYANYAFKTIGNEGVLRLLEGERCRRAYFKSVLAYSTPEEDVRCFLGEVVGRISLTKRGIQGFGFDPIFEPEGWSGRTFGEMGCHEKNACSHRAQAARRFADWLTGEN